ncbi:MAG: hypothetical protein FD167_4298, partial [bacterium]
MLDQVKFFFKLYYNPINAFGNIIDKGSLWTGIITVAFVSVFFWFAITNPIYDEYENPVNLLPKPSLPSSKVKSLSPSDHITSSSTPLTTSSPKPIDESNPSPTTDEMVEETDDYETDPYPYSYLSVGKRPIIKKPLPIVDKYGWWFVSFSQATTFISVLSLALIYVPITILILIFIEPLGSYGVVFRRDYAPLLACTLMSWAATHLPFSIVGLAVQPINPEIALILWVLSKLSFGLLMVFALRVVFSVGYFTILITLAISWSSIILESAIFWVTSPFLLFWIYYYLRGDIGTVGMDVATSFRQRQSFRRYLEACTINPQDAEAHYQLGLIHQQRRQYSEALSRFRKAVEIDKREIDAHFQLGVIAREQNRLQEAISHFDAVVLLNEKHSNSEAWREIGATYEAAGMNEDARQALEKYVERRPYDAEGL